MTHKIALCAATMLAIAGMARADGLDPIAVRQAGMGMAGGSFGLVRSVVAAKGDVKPLEAPARAMAEWGKLIPALFPVGTDKGHNTKALPEVWSDRAGFEKSAADMTEAATKLADAAKAGDSDAVGAQAKLLGEACGGCHRHYRQKL